jgi:hypothetical protein
VASVCTARASMPMAPSSPPSATSSCHTPHSPPALLRSWPSGPLAGDQLPSTWRSWVFVRLLSRGRGRLASRETGGDDIEGCEAVAGETEGLWPRGRPRFLTGASWHCSARPIRTQRRHGLVLCVWRVVL